MDNKITTIKDRCLQLAKVKGFPYELFCDRIGMTYGNFKGKAKKTPLNSAAIVNILAIISDVNLEWLLTGHGSMLRDEQPTQAPVQASEPTIIYKSDPKDLKMIEDKAKIIALQEEKIEMLEEKLHDRTVGLHSARSVDTTPGIGTQHTRK